jgi:hypothetical protein
VIGNSSMVKWRKQFLPTLTPPLRGKDVDLHMFVNSDHAGDKLMQWSHTGFLIYLNMAPIVWHSKKQSTIKTSMLLWCWVCCYEARHGGTARPMIQTMNDESSLLFVVLHVALLHHHPMLCCHCWAARATVPDNKSP